MDQHIQWVLGERSFFNIFRHATFAVQLLTQFYCEGKVPAPLATPVTIGKALPGRTTGGSDLPRFYFKDKLTRHNSIS